MKSLRGKLLNRNVQQLDHQPNHFARRKVFPRFLAGLLREPPQ